MYCICDWDENYEVDSNGRRWKPGSSFFAGPLPYVRCPARRDWPVRLLHVERKLGEQVYMVLGVFEKLTSIVACEKRPGREGGVIRNSKHEPASLSDIAMMLLLSEERTKWVMDILTASPIEWIAVQPEGKLESPPEGEGEPSAKLADNSEAQRETAKLADNSEARGFLQKTASCQVRVRTDHINTESEKDSNTEKGPRLLKLSSDSTAAQGGDSRPDVKCFEILTDILQPQESKDFTALSNFVQWLQANMVSARASPNAYNEAISIAKDSLNGDCPMAVFTSRVKKQWGYKPPSHKRGVM